MEYIGDICDYLNQIFDGDQSVPCRPMEEFGDEAIIPFKVKYGKMKVLLFGAGSRGCYVLSWLRRKQINPVAVIDSNCKKAGTDFYGIRVITLEDVNIMLQREPDNYLVVMATSLCTGLEQIKRRLYLSGVVDIVEIVRDHIIGIEEANRQHYFLQNREKMMNVLGQMGDQKSKEVLCEYLRGIFVNDYYMLPILPSVHKYMGDGLFENRKDEVFVSVGGSTGDTIFYFLENYSEFSKIFCFEGESLAYASMQSNLTILPTEVESRIEAVNRFVGKKTEGNVVKLDDVLADSNVSLISMDIEGMELEALMGAESVICEYLPILAICAYHKKEDLIELTAYIHSLSDQYQFFVRKYASHIKWTNGELVLYAIPKSRLL